MRTHGIPAARAEREGEARVHTCASRDTPHGPTEIVFEMDSRQHNNATTPQQPDSSEGSRGESSPRCGQTPTAEPAPGDRRPVVVCWFWLPITWTRAAPAPRGHADPQRQPPPPHTHKQTRLKQPKPECEPAPEQKPGLLPCTERSRSAATSQLHGSDPPPGGRLAAAERSLAIPLGSRFTRWTYNPQRVPTPARKEILPRTASTALVNSVRVACC